MEIRKAERVKSKLRLGLVGTAGSGKTYSALKLAKGLGGKVCLVDTENGSGDLYAHLFEYSVLPLGAPYAPKRYVEAIKQAEEAGFDVIIVDSLSHAWNAEGGILDQVDKKAGMGGGSFGAWRDATPQHNQLIEAMLQSSAHIIATMRSKTAYEVESYQDTKGATRTRPVKIGLAPVQREGMDFEFTVVMDINQGHNAMVSKDRTNMFKDEVFVIDEKVGERLNAWLNEGRVNSDNAKKEIIKLLSKLDFIPVVDGDQKKQYEAEVIRVTGMNLVEENFENIIQKLKEVIAQPKTPEAPKQDEPTNKDAEVVGTAQ